MTALGLHSKAIGHLQLKHCIVDNERDPQWRSEHVLPAKVGPLAPLSGIPCQNMHSLSKHAQNMNSTPFSATLGGAPFMHHMLYVNCYSKEGQAKSPMYSSAEFPHAFPGTLCPRPASLTQSVICKSNLVPRNQWRIGEQRAASKSR